MPTPNLSIWPVFKTDVFLVSWGWFDTESLSPPSGNWSSKLTRFSQLGRIKAKMILPSGFSLPVLMSRVHASSCKYRRMAISQYPQSSIK